MFIVYTQTKWLMDRMTKKTPWWLTIPPPHLKKKIKNFFVMERVPACCITSFGDSGGGGGGVFMTSIILGSAWTMTSLMTSFSTTLTWTSGCHSMADAARLSVSLNMSSFLHVWRSMPAMSRTRSLKGTVPASPNKWIHMINCPLL